MFQINVIYTVGPRIPGRLCRVHRPSISLHNAFIYRVCRIILSQWLLAASYRSFVLSSNGICAAEAPHLEAPAFFPFLTPRCGDCSLRAKAGYYASSSPI